MSRKKKKVTQPEVEVNIQEKEEILEPEVQEKEEILEPELEPKEKEKDAVVRRIKENAAMFNQEYFEKCRKSGCDYSARGLWQEKYAKLMDRVAGGMAGKNVLDVGGAFGAIASAFADVGAAQKVVCTDISKHVIDQKKFKNVEYEHCPVQHMKSINSKSFDVVHVSHVLNSVSEKDLERSVKELSRVLKSGGICIMIHSNEIPGLKELVEKHIGNRLDVKLTDFDGGINLASQYKWSVLTAKK